MPGSVQGGAQQFETVVRESFRFLESEYDFVRREFYPSGSSAVVRYDTSSLYVFLAFGPPDYEPTMSFGRRGIDDIPAAYNFGPGDLIQLECCKDWQWNPSHSDRMTGYVAEFARLLMHCGKQCLLGVESVFEEMRSRRDKLIVRSNEGEFARAVREKITAAWGRKDYKRVVELYEQMDGQLDELDKMRLRFAMSHS
jgi:hypothetical protein